MIHLRLNDKRHHRLPFYLAMEEWAAKTLPANDYFFAWQVNPTVIFGRNQCIDTEVNLEYCRENGIETFRRKSGGGCVFADRHNIMFSYITPSEHVVTTFAHYTEMIASMLRKLGIHAKASGRNDITIDDAKVSGNSFYHLPGRSIVHGTMLFDTDFTHMANAITPSRSKLESKQVQSVESHITTLCRHTNISIDEFISFAIKELTSQEINITENDIAEINELAEPYYNPDWIFGRKHKSQIRREMRIEGVGEFAIGINICGGKIESLDMEGDFFIIGDLDDALLCKFKGVDYSLEAISAQARELQPQNTIAHLSSDQLINLIKP